LSSRTAARAAAVSADMGPLPEWDLTDLYPAMDSLEFARDLSQAEAECKAFADTYRGRLDTWRAAPTHDGAGRRGLAI
jgi:oligoendopeptidase F